AWGGAKEQAAERAKGKRDAKNWLLEAETIVKRTSSSSMPSYSPFPSSSPIPGLDIEMNDAPNPLTAEDDLDYDQLRRKQIQAEDSDEGWEREYERYNKDLARDVERDTDLVKWWFDNSDRYPILARIALDVLPVQASSVACERLFSSAKLTATDLRSRLGTDEFEELQLLKFAWKREIIDMAKDNETCEQEIAIDEEFYRGLDALDTLEEEWDNEVDAIGN
ncbi:hATC-domain-containing protein, partial [Sistotremastrum suecicum HHB10207 ss-3]